MKRSYLVGDFILNFLKKENINIKNIPKINGSRTSAVLLGIEPPNNFPLVFYRDNAADSMININHVNHFQIERCKILVISGTALNKEPSRSAVIHAIKIANKNNIPIIHDLDFRLDQWKNVSSFGKLTKSILPLINIVIGTEEEKHRRAEAREEGKWEKKKYQNLFYLLMILF